MTVRMGYDFAITVINDESETTPLKKQGQAYKNDIRVERQKLSQIDTKVMSRKIIEPK